MEKSVLLILNRIFNQNHLKVFDADDTLSVILTYKTEMRNLENTIQLLKL